MKKITYKTLLKQGDKVYQPIEYDDNVYWVDPTVLVGMKGDWVVETHNPIVTSVCQIIADNADLRAGGYRDLKVIAQSQPKLDLVPTVSLDSYTNTLSEQACKKQDLAGGFSGGVHERAAAGIFFRKGFKSNSCQYTQSDIERAIELAREQAGWSDNTMEDRYTKEEILEQINSISVIEVDEYFNVIGYE